MRYLIESLYVNGNCAPGFDRIEVVGARYEINDDVIKIYDYDDNLAISKVIDRNDECFKFINLDNGDIIFQNE